ncbi:MAG: methyltransferase domain-containing protein [Candidatus Competibacteraceae bacterium]|nr:methyltransferase domain-containing protein [Candidatus Competibacteraceae bacterium]
MTNLHPQHWNANHYAKNARFVADLGAPVVEWLAPQPGEHILDLGCGDGTLTLKLVDLGCDVVGVDASPEMIAAAQMLGLNAQVMAGQNLHFDNEFDAVFSNAALHWMPNHHSVIAGVRRALKPGGRFVAEMGGYGNVAAIVTAIESALAARGITVANPWYFPRLEEYQKLLETGGFSVERITLFPRPTLLPGDVGGWLETFAKSYTAALPAADRKAFIAEVVEALRPVFTDKQGVWVADYVRLRFSATKSKTVT